MSRIAYSNHSSNCVTTNQHQQFCLKSFSKIFFLVHQNIKAKGKTSRKMLAFSLILLLSLFLQPLSCSPIKAATPTPTQVEQRLTHLNDPAFAATTLVNLIVPTIELMEQIQHKQVENYGLNKGDEAVSHFKNLQTLLQQLQSKLILQNEQTKMSAAFKQIRKEAISWFAQESKNLEDELLKQAHEQWIQQAAEEMKQLAATYKNSAEALEQLVAEPIETATPSTHEEQQLAKEYNPSVRLMSMVQLVRVLKHESTKDPEFNLMANVELLLPIVDLVNQMQDEGQVFMHLKQGTGVFSHSNKIQEILEQLRLELTQQNEIANKSKFLKQIREEFSQRLMKQSQKIEDLLQSRQASVDSDDDKLSQAEKQLAKQAKGQLQRMASTLKNLAQELKQLVAQSDE